jgi:hypothetical protein
MSLSCSFFCLGGAFFFVIFGLIFVFDDLISLILVAVGSGGGAGAGGGGGGVDVSIHNANVPSAQRVI